MKSNGPVLIIDDDQKLRDLLVEYLADYDFQTHTLPSGMQAIETISKIKPSVIVLDVMMPGKDGLEVLRDIRAEYATPVIMLTAKGEDTDRIVGLELGADDYMAKPFNPRELLARIKAVLRRIETNGEKERKSGQSVIKAGGLVLNVSRQTLEIGNVELEMAPTEFRLLKALMTHQDKALTRDELMDMVWDKDFSAYDRSIDVHVSKLRSQLKPYSDHAKRIKTVWGTGYMFVGER
ncbi:MULTISPECIES: response regulator transcription factor [unclassified Pseudodesulfovibrio]|uniref:response regulator n=1 Tax=unclassified Pseudodesulfovibrio TaxID=2661612 RepID=UPI000FEBA98A|nr:MULTISPECIES: response regulator transcription factor [unclassified Pseudodesulfovibrio]MCJ2164006.1 response regulator transcription factor [Pseudodesulfovibrio sp. S3-i]RWU05356.1 DNA-binding response regulator [Pseudodesulfovibrio sp. S3]